jgi:hypothetical protein
MIFTNLKTNFDRGPFYYGILQVQWFVRIFEENCWENLGLKCFFNSAFLNFFPNF